MKIIYNLALSPFTVKLDKDRILVLLCYNLWTPQNGHRQSRRSRERARMMRKVVMECGLCRSGRMRTSGPEVAREFGD
jgi:hypothetical protein